MATNSTFFGTAEETHYIDAKGRWWLVQSPDMGAGVVAYSSAGPSEEASELRWDACSDFHVLASGLDHAVHGPITADFVAESGPVVEFVTLGDVRSRFGEEAYASAKTCAKGETEQLWAHETTLTKL